MPEVEDARKRLAGLKGGYRAGPGPWLSSSAAIPPVLMRQWDYSPVLYNFLAAS